MGRLGRRHPQSVQALSRRNRSTLGLAGLIAALLPAVSGAAELEPIEVLSRLGQPFVAEIRVTDLPPDSPAISVAAPPASAYARVGLARPRGAAASLTYAIRTGPDGRPVIRVTSSAPVTEEFLTFLVQLDWSHGSLVREFSVALEDTLPAAALPTTRVTGTQAADGIAPAAATDAPAVDPADVSFDPSQADTTAASTAEMAAIAPPPIPLAPAAAPRSPTSEPSPASATPPASATTAAPIRVTAAAGTRRTPVPAPSQAPASTPSLPATPAAVAPRGTVTATPTAASPSPVLDAPSARSIGPVGRGSTLTGIAREAMGTDVALDTALVALLLANPEAFAGGNINRLQQGATLDVPSAATLAAIDPALARQVVSLQAEAWRTGGTDAQQAALTKALSDIATGLTSARPVVPTEPRTAPARLRIVAPDDARAPSDAPGMPRAGSPDPGLAVETLAARDMEIRDLRERLAELERDNAAQRKVIALQNNAIGSAQAHLQPAGSGLVERIAGSAWAWMALLFAAVTATVVWRRGATASARGRPGGGRPPAA